jgi:hypothetical protein
MEFLRSSGAFNLFTLMRPGSSFSNYSDPCGSGFRFYFAADPDPATQIIRIHADLEVGTLVTKPQHWTEALKSFNNVTKISKINCRNFSFD